MIDVLHVSDDLDFRSGGVAAVVRELVIRGETIDIRGSVICARGWAESEEPSTAYTVCKPAAIGETWRWSRKLNSAISERATALKKVNGILHIHGVWSAPQFRAGRVGKAVGVRTVLSAHGMLDPWLWNRQGLVKAIKKMAYWKALAFPAFRSVNVVHAITPLERTYLRRLFPGTRTEVVPNAIDIGEGREGVRETPEKRIVFLGRIEPKKGVDLLIAAFSGMRASSDWILEIAGPIWSVAYHRRLIRLVSDLNLSERVRLVGPMAGEEKRKFLARAWIMAVPSYSEAMGLVNLEAAAVRLPTVTTFQTGLHDWDHGGGVLIEPNVSDLRGALEEAVSWSDSERVARGDASHELVRLRYSWQAVAPLWRELYTSI